MGTNPTMTGKPLDAAFIASLLQESSIQEAYEPTCECGSRLDNGYCRNPDCPVDSPIETYECPACGNCPTPDKCVASISCPVCSSGVGMLCLDLRGGYTGYHEERWLKVKELYDTYYI